MADICNEDLKVKFTNNGGPPDLVSPGDQGIDAVKIVPIKASKAKANSKKICTSNIALTWTGACPFTSTLYNFVAGGGTIAAGATKVKCDSQAVLLKGDSGTCKGSWTLKASPFTPSPCSCDVEISDAGQSKVKGI